MSLCNGDLEAENEILKQDGERDRLEGHCGAGDRGEREERAEKVGDGEEGVVRSA